MAATNFIKMVNTILYLHQNSISHRDIKPENFLFKTTKTEVAKSQNRKIP